MRTTGAIQIFGVKTGGGEVADPDKEISLEDAQKIRRRRRDRCGNPLSQAHRCAGPHFRADRQAGDSAKGARSRARERVFGIFGPRRRTGHLRGQAHRRSGPDVRTWARPKRGCSRKSNRKLESFSVGDRIALRDQERGKGRQERGRDYFARRAGAGDAPVRAGSAGDLRQHGGHQRLRARSRRAHQDRRLQPRPRRG